MRNAGAIFAFAFALAVCSQARALEGSVPSPPATSPGSGQPAPKGERFAEIIQREPASSAGAPHIDWVTLQEERRGENIVIVQKIGYHSLKGNANNLRLQLVSVSNADAGVSLSDHAIRAPVPRQQRGTFLLVRHACRRIDMGYSYVARAIIISTDGERSNTVDFTVDCNLAVTS
jgi:hypothetical protein